MNLNSNSSTSAEKIKAEAAESKQKMYVIERDIPGAGKLNQDELSNIAQKSNRILEELGPNITWLHSYVTGDKIYCVYTAPNEELVREHALKGGFPADSVSQVINVIDPNTGV